MNRKIRVVIDWTLALFLKREVVSLGELHQPREPFTDVTPPSALIAKSALTGYRMGSGNASVPGASGWWNGRHSRLKSGSRKAYGFESRSGHGAH